MGTANLRLKGETMLEIERKLEESCLEASNLGLFEERRSPVLVENGELTVYIQFHT